MQLGPSHGEIEVPGMISIVDAAALERRDEREREGSGGARTQYLTTEQLVSTELPESIGNLTNLTLLNVWGNQLTSEFPRTFLSPPKTQHTVLIE